MSDIVPIREVERTRRRSFRHEVPAAHRSSLDTRLEWMWNQRFGTVQQIYVKSPDLLDVTAATLIIQCVFGPDLQSIEILLSRLEGAAQEDEVVQAEDERTMQI